MHISDERIGQIMARLDEISARMASGALEGAAFVQASKDYAELEPVAAAARHVAR
ncbi:MAG: peptide chain release factor 1, partial [Sphingopyxis sp.]